MKKFLLTFLAFTLSTSAFAEGGSHVGNGGGVWTCRAESSGHPLIWAELVDLSEGRREFNLSIPKSTELTREQWITLIEARMRGANAEFYAAYQKHMAIVREKFMLVHNSQFTTIGDDFHRTAPDAQVYCPTGTVQYEQLANFTTEDHLIVNDEIWSDPVFTEIDRAALYIHEAVYSLLRERAGAHDSVKAREIVGRLFSNQPVTEFDASLILPAIEPPAPVVITPAPVVTPVTAVAPLLGLYHATQGDWTNMEITYFDSARRLVYLTERDRHSGKDKQHHVFRCDSAIPEVTCELIQTTNGAISKLANHHLRISDPTTFVWLANMNSGVMRATRYRP